MAAVINLKGGAVPAGSPSSNTVNMFTPIGSGTTDGNGNSLNRRMMLQGPNGETFQLTDSKYYNLIRNGGFWFAQRQAPGTATTYSATAGRAVSADGWGITNENASATFQQLTTDAAIQAGYQNRYYGEFLKITSTGKLVISQVIEGSESIGMRNRTLRFTAWMKSANSLSMKMALLYLTGAGTVDSIPATFVSAFNAAGTDPTFGTNIGKCTAGFNDDGTSLLVNNVFTCSLATTWTRFSGAFTVPNDCKNLIPCIWTDGQPAATQGFDIGQVSLTDGYENQDWGPQSYSEERLKVLRFYQKSFADTGIAPAQNVGLGTGEYYGMAGKAGANPEFIAIRYEPQMRSPPNLTLFNPSAANNQLRDVSGSVDCSGTGTAVTSLRGFNVTATGNAATAVGNQIAIHWTADAEI